jgi:trichothecene 3-O-acetyltransferase
MRQPGLFGQLCWDTYTVVVLGFTTDSKSTPESVTKELDQAAIKLCEAYPFLSGQVILEKRTSTNSGTYRIIPFAPHTNKSLVAAKDCTQSCPTYGEILNANAPFSMLDGDVLCPKKGLGYVYDSSKGQPVLLIQANFVRGGLLLCFASMHNALDMNGQHIMMRQFAACMRGDEPDPKLVEQGNRDIDVPLLEDGEVVLEHADLRKPSALTATNGGSPPAIPSMRWLYWRLPKDSLVELKKQATSNSSTKVSTNDVITAFWTQRLTTARLNAGQLLRDEPIDCIRAVDARSKLDPPVPKGYLGHFVTIANTTWSAGAIRDSSLSNIAHDLRKSLQDIDDHTIRSFATLVQNTEDKTTIFYGAKKKHGKDIFLSSWAQMDLCQTCDFGSALGGRPDFVRRAKLDLVPDLTYIMPPDKNGNMDIGACIFEGDIDALSKDGPWRKYTKLIG